jgi:hypothetical protein
MRERKIKHMVLTSKEWKLVEKADVNFISSLPGFLFPNFM